MKKLAIIIMSLTLLSGCAAFQQNIINLSQDDLKNAETTRTVAKNFLSTWPLKSGVIRGALGTGIQQLPAESVAAMASLDELAAKPTPTDTDLGMSIGLVIQMSGDIVLAVIKQYAPQAVQYIPAIWGLK